MISGQPSARVERRTAKECWLETDVLLLSHADQPIMLAGSWILKTLYTNHYIMRNIMQMVISWHTGTWTGPETLETDWRFNFLHVNPV